MKLSRTIEILEEILSLEGKCLSHSRCVDCPFKEKCLPEFIKDTNRLSSNERSNMALDALSYNHLLDDELVS